MLTIGPASKSEQIKEILKCGKDSVYFIRTYARIQHPKDGLIPFKTFPFQDDCLKSFEENRFNIILKSRQLGLTTITAAYAVWYALFKKDKNILVIATKLQTAMGFIKKVKCILEGLPKWLMLTKYDATKQSITFANGSTITAIPTSPDAGRSEALSLLIVDECVGGDTRVEVRDTITGEEISVTMQQLQILLQQDQQNVSHIIIEDEEDMDKNNSARFVKEF